ncbi:MAG TPA: POTRA domain-containing protein [Burkholderiaceae bacterium]
MAPQLKTTLCLMLAGLSAATVQAQTSDNRSNFQRTLPRAPTPERQRVQPLQQQPVRDLTELENTRVRPTAFKIAGARAVPFGEVAALFNPLLNTDTTVGQLLAAARQATALYNARGYALSYAYIPLQDFAGGVVQVVVVEGYVGSLSLQNAPPHYAARIRALAAPVLAERPLRRATFERAVTLISRLPGIGVDANVPVPENTQGASELQLGIRYKKFATSAAFDFNHPGVQGILGASVNGMTALADQLTVSAMAPRGKFDKRYYALDYALPVGDRGWTARLNAYRYDGKDSAFPFNGAVLSKMYGDNRVGLSASYPVIASASTLVVAELGAYGGASGESYRAPNEPSRLDLRTKTRVLQGGVSGSKQGETNAMEAGVQLAKGVKGAGAGQLEDLADLGFHKVRVNARRNDQWAGGSWKTSVSGVAQHTRSRLPSSEKIVFGGAYFGAAYPASDISGDRGWAVAAEVAKPLAGATAMQVEPFAGVDAMRVRSTVFEVQRGMLGSAIVGVRLARADKFSVSLAVAKPVGARPLGESGRPWRWSVQSAASF